MDRERMRMISYDLQSLIESGYSTIKRKSPEVRLIALDLKGRLRPDTLGFTRNPEEKKIFGAKRRG